MKKNVLRKDFFMEIRKSMGRFLSIFLIVALGVSILVGIRATEPDMLLSGDQYADNNQLMDIKIVSTYGLTEEDADVIERLPAIESVEGSYSTDVLCEAGDNMKVLHVMSLTDNMNQVTVTEGRLPKNVAECLVDADFLETSEYEIGDMISFESGTDDELNKTLKKTQFKIVGAGDSPLYFSFDRGSSTIGNGSVSGFAYVVPETFDLDVYTEIYAIVEDAEEAVSFTDAYDELVDEAIEQIELVQNARCEVRRDDLAEMAQIEIDNARKELSEKKEEAEKEITKNEDLLNASELELELGKLQIQSGKTGIESGKAQIESAKAQIESGKEQLEMSKSILEGTRKELENGRNQLEERRKANEEEIDSLEQQLTDLEQQILEWQEKVDSAEGDEAEAAQNMLDSLLESKDDISAQLEETKSESETQLAEMEKILSEAEKMIAETESELAAQEAELLSQEKLLLSKEKELLEQEKKLNSSEKDIESGEKDIAEGKEELEEAKEEMETQIKDGEEEIDKAEEEIGDIELPVWYIFDRSAIPEYNGFGDNAARIAALAIVFPSIFFLVAALISLTTMTRMVEEQRVQIGTLKALGYSKFAIMKKYLYYALGATLGGSIVGVLVGEKLFPYVIITAYYGTVYTNIPDMVLPYQWGVALLATVIAVLCTGGATISACYKELVAQPAVLMRPEAPKIGKRTLIEKIPFLWKHLNFTWKSSLRNLFRYKKRFFMTLFGIGGCMGLLMVGYGLRDSISSISRLQYGELQLYDSSVFVSDDREEEEIEALETYLKDNKDISEYMNVYMGNITTQHDEEEVDAYLTVISDMELIDQFFVFQDRGTKERYELTDEGVILSEKTANMLDVKVGDKILLTEEGKNEQKVKVTDICENYVSHYVYMTEALYEKVYDKELESNTILIKADGLSMKELEGIGEEILTYQGIMNVQYTENLTQSLDDMLVALDKVMVVLIIVAGLLSFVVLYNLNNINITERRRELATLKVLGFYDMEVATYVYRENVLLTFFGTLVGCVIGKYLHLFTVTTVEVDMAMFGREVSLMSYLICAAFTIGFSAIVNWMMYFKLKKIDMVESLKSVE